jgi:TRAP-type C4-dicarboxylate transport system permease small subunit
MLKVVCDALESALRVVLCVLLTVMTVTVVWQVASRLLARASVAYGLPLLIEPSRWTEELASFQLGWLALLGAAYALRKHEHLGFDFLYLKMTRAAQQRTELLVRGLVVAFALVVLVYGGTRLVVMTSQLHQTTAGLQWPMAVIYGVIPITGILMALFALEGGVFGRDESQLAEGQVEGAAL